MSKGRQKGGYVRKADLAVRMQEYFESHQGTPVDIKTLFRELSLKTHPAKLLCMDVIDEMLMDDYLKEVGPMRYQTAAPVMALEGIFQRKSNGKNTVVLEGGGEPILVAERNAMHALDGDRVRVQMMEIGRASCRERV